MFSLSSLESPWCLWPWTLRPIRCCWLFRVHWHCSWNLVHSDFCWIHSIDNHRSRLHLLYNQFANQLVMLHSLSPLPAHTQNILSLEIIQQTLANLLRIFVDDIRKGLGELGTATSSESFNSDPSNLKVFSSTNHTDHKQPQSSHQLLLSILTAHHLPAESPLLSLFVEPLTELVVATQHMLSASATSSAPISPTCDLIAIFMSEVNKKHPVFHSQLMSQVHRLQITTSTI